MPRARSIVFDPAGGRATTAATTARAGPAAPATTTATWSTRSTSITWVRTRAGRRGPRSIGAGDGHGADRLAGRRGVGQLVARGDEQRREQPGRGQERPGRNGGAGLDQEQGEVHDGRRRPSATQSRRWRSNSASAAPGRRPRPHERRRALPREQRRGPSRRAATARRSGGSPLRSASRQPEDAGGDHVALDLRRAAADRAGQRRHPRLLPPARLGRDRADRAPRGRRPADRARARRCSGAARTWPAS